MVVAVARVKMSGSDLPTVGAVALVVLLSGVLTAMDVNQVK